MGMPAAPLPDTTRHWTADEVRALGDETRAWPRYECVDGELLVTPGPSYDRQEAVARLWRVLMVGGG